MRQGSATLRVPVGGEPFQPRRRKPLPERRRTSTPDPISAASIAAAVDPDPPLAPTPAPEAATLALDAPLLAQVAHAEAARARAHADYLQFTRDLEQSMLATTARQMQLTEQLLRSTSGSATALAPAGPPTSLDREACLEFAIGSIGRVLGEAYAAIDAHPTRVRLPDEPLMLVDRILDVQGEPLSMTGGRVVTEHDVGARPWYLDCGVIPTCIAVEAGQADLFLSGWLGIRHDHEGRRGVPAARRRSDLPRRAAGAREGDPLRHRDRALLPPGRHPPVLFQLRRQRGRASGDLDARGLRRLLHCRGARRRRGHRAHAPGHPVPVRAAVRTTGAPWRRWPRGRRTTQPKSGRCARAISRRASGPRSRICRSRAQRPCPADGSSSCTASSHLDPDGGRFGLGLIRGEADIHADDWFLTCHFSDDMVMPGTLMYECCLHTLRIYLLRMGWVGERGSVRYEPVPGVHSRLKCRGQVTHDTRGVTYEIELKELGYDPAPFAIVDALMYADGKAIVEITDMSVRLSGLVRADVEALWSDAERPPVFTRAQVLAFADGRPSEAFGAPYAPFDEERFIARLPRPPYSCLDRVRTVSAPPWRLEAGARATAEYDVPPDAWYFEANRQAEMPYAVLLEVGLQPCGWLAAWLGSALAGEEDLRFRNLGGRATQLRRVTQASGTLCTDVHLTDVSHSAGMIIERFRLRVRDAHGPVFEGETYFGFFTSAALADQVGLPDAVLCDPVTQDAQAQPGARPYPGTAPFPTPRFRMVERLERVALDGGPHGLGVVDGSIAVDPEAWFFRAHFKDDPVWPGSLGCESFLQLLKAYAAERWGADAATQWQGNALGREHRWTYRGQVLPTAGRVRVQAVVTEVDDASRRVVADGHLLVDGRVIYALEGYSLEPAPA